uniref:Interleukin 34 n=1 Tax=Sinocyclocheilus grahami TaxID=75366 RepID=A0A672PDU9_SINGR
MIISCILCLLLLTTCRLQKLLCCGIMACKFSFSFCLLPGCAFLLEDNMSNEEEPVLKRDLQDLWLWVSQRGIKRVLRVLPERHPTRHKYLSNLENLFRDFEALYYKRNPKDEERELPERILNIVYRLTDPSYEGWKSVTPKSILDNCYRTMLCLFKECFSKEDDNYDYCEVLNWRKGKKTT